MKIIKPNRGFESGTNISAFISVQPANDLISGNRCMDTSKNQENLINTNHGYRQMKPLTEEEKNTVEIQFKEAYSRFLNSIKEYFINLITLAIDLIMLTALIASMLMMLDGYAQITNFITG